MQTECQRIGVNLTSSLQIKRKCFSGSFVPKSPPARLGYLRTKRETGVDDTIAVVDPQRPADEMLLDLMDRNRKAITI